MFKKIKKIIISIPGTVFVYSILKRLYLLPGFLSDFKKFKRIAKSERPELSLKFKDLFLCLNDKTKETGFEPHYLYHIAWAIRKVKEINPKKHIDISSSLYFSTTLSAFIPVDFYDYRPADIKLSNLNSKRADLLSLPFADNSLESLSCLHTIEHVGLGRYGDRMDPNGDLKAISELKRVLAPQGSLLFVVPIGQPKIEYNAHRIYSYDQIISYFPDLELKEFSLIPDNFEEKGIVVNASPEIANEQRWGCGCFWFIKK